MSRRKGDRADRVVARELRGCLPPGHREGVGDCPQHRGRVGGRPGGSDRERPGLRLPRSPQGHVRPRLTAGRRAAGPVRRRPPTTVRRMATAGDDRRETDSGIEVKPVYTAADVARPRARACPASFPSRAARTRTCTGAGRGRSGSTRASARRRSRTHATATCSSAGRPGSRSRSTCRRSSATTRTTRARAARWGATGVAIDSLADMEILSRGIPLGEVSTSMTINAPAALLLLLYELVAERQDVPAERLRGTVQNDILKEYIARGNYIFPPRPSMRITTDLFAYCRERLPRWNTISISGYHIREAGSTAAQELAFTLANGIAYCEAAVAAGLSPDEFGERLSFFFNAHNHFFQEVAKFRAARRLWASIMRDRFAVTNPRALALRFHAQTGGSTLTAQQPENNVVRVAIQALSAVCGGAQSLHTNGFDEALALPTERSARIALRTQQILATEAGATDTADPLGGAYFVEALTKELEERALRADRADRRARRRRRGGRGRVRPARDRGVRAGVSAGGRDGGARRRRRQPLHRGGGRTDRAAPARPGGRAAADRADGAGAGAAGSGPGRAGSRRCPGDGAG